MTENEFGLANNLFSVRLMKSILAGIIPNEVITEKDQNDLKMMLHRWEHNSHKSFDVTDESEDDLQEFLVDSESDEQNVSHETSNNGVTESKMVIQ